MPQFVQPLVRSSSMSECSVLFLSSVYITSLPAPFYGKFKFALINLWTVNPDFGRTAFGSPATHPDNVVLNISKSAHVTNENLYMLEYSE